MAYLLREGEARRRLRRQPPHKGHAAAKGGALLRKNTQSEHRDGDPLVSKEKENAKIEREREREEERSIEREREKRRKVCVCVCACVSLTVPQGN